MERTELFEYDCGWYASDHSPYQVGNNNSPLFAKEIRRKSWSVWTDNGNKHLFTGSKKECLEYLKERTGNAVALLPGSSIDRKNGRS